jgi:hypothetical protein
MFPWESVIWLQEMAAILRIRRPFQTWGLNRQENPLSSVMIMDHFWQCVAWKHFWRSLEYHVSSPSPPHFAVPSTANRPDLLRTTERLRWRILRLISSSVNTSRALTQLFTWNRLCGFVLQHVKFIRCKNDVKKNVNTTNIVQMETVTKNM